MPHVVDCQIKIILLKNVGVDD